MQCIRAIIVCVLLIGSRYDSFGQTTIFAESFGTPGGTTAIGSYSGYDNSGSLMFSGTGDIRSTKPSSGYSGASGGGNVFLTDNSSTSLTISNIDTTGFEPGSLTLSFGAYKDRIAADMTDLTVGFSTNGTDYTLLSFPAQPTGTGTSIWRAISVSNSHIIPISSTLSLQWINTTGDTDFAYRIDDVVLSGTAIPEPSTYALLAGVGALGFAFWRRRRLV